MLGNSKERHSAPLFELELSHEKNGRRTSTRITVGSSMIVGLLPIVVFNYPHLAHISVLAEKLLTVFR